MSISSSLSNAMSGLTAVSRAAELVSSNVANAMTEGYGRREIQLGSATAGSRGAGVSIVGVQRVVNDVAVADRRLSDAALGYHDTRASLFATVERLVGTPNEESSLSAHMDRFDQSVISAAANPSSTARLSAVVNDAVALTSKFNGISREIIGQRERADKSIESMVDNLNEALLDVDRLNSEIRRQLGTGGTASGLMDQRQVVIDRVAEIIPIQEVPRDHGEIVLITPNGTTLVDSGAAQFQFQITPVITPDMSLSSGALSGLSISGAASVNGAALDSIAGGALAAAFELRDVDIPEMQNNLDALASNLMSRAADADLSLSAGNPGLFTDSQALPGNPILAGVASRMTVHSSIDPAKGGNVWRIRDGAEAASQGPVADNSLLSALVSEMAKADVPSGGDFSDAGSSSALIGDFASKIGQARYLEERRQGFEASKVQAFSELEQSFGVDTDQELQKLLLIEQNFAANAKVIQTVDELLQSLLRI